MPQPTKGPRLGGGPAHERLLLANLAAALFTHRSIQTTETKAKRLRPLAERLITFAKRGDLHARRRVLSIISDKGVVHELFTEIAPAMAEREGGYTRITKVGPRKGDNAPMALIELVTESVEDSRKANAKVAAPAKKAPAKKAPAKSASSAAASAAAATPAAPAASAAEPAAADEAPAEKLVDETSELEEATSADERPSDESSAEEAVAVDAADEDDKTEEKA